MSAPLGWPAAAATGVGSLPGIAPREAARIVVGELPDFVHVAELPERGPGADAIGRTGGLLAAVSTDLALETTPGGWRFTPGAVLGRQMRAAASLLGEDLDALEERAGGYAGPVKCQLAGPWTFASAVELVGGERAVRDAAAVRDIAEGLAEAVAAHVADLRRRIPGATAIVVQLDEPSLAAVVAGHVRTASGLSVYSAPEPSVVEDLLGRVLRAATAAGAVAGVHCCADDAPVDVLRAAGAAFVGLDLTLELSPQSRDDRDRGIGAALEAGVGLHAGTVPALPPADLGPVLGDARASAPLRDLISRIGLSDPAVLGLVAVTPSCGLAGASPAWVRVALTACRSVGRVVRDDEAEPVHDE